MKKIFFLIIFITMLFVTGCAQKVTIKALQPAQIDRISETKKIAVLNFKNDYVALSRKIEAKLASCQINNKKYFTIVSRNDINTIISEQKLQNSGLVNEKSVVKVGELIGAQAIISGNVGKATKEDSYFFEKRIRCADAKCNKLVAYKIRCMKRIVGLSAEIRIVDVTRGDIIFADTLGKNRVYKHCRDDSRVIPSTTIAAQSIAESIADEFTYKLTPHYRYFSVALLDDPDLDYSSEQEKLLKYALEYIEDGRYDKAEDLLTRLIDSTGSKSYVAFYDLGVVKEAEGKYKEAKEYYEYADHLMIKPVEEINAAIIRINGLIANRKKTLEQLNR